MKENPRIKSIEEATHKTWNEWLRFMDSIHAKDLDHTAIAQKVHEELEGSIESAGWWSQSVTVAYEQHIGRRLPGQRSDGTFEVSVSKSTELGMKNLMKAWVSFAEKDKEVQALLAEEARAGGTEKRLTWRAKGKDGSAILITCEPKPNGTAAIIATLAGLKTEAQKNKAKTKWSEIVTRFLETLH